MATRSSRFLVSASSLPHFPFVVPSLPKSPHGQDGSPPCADQPHQSTAAVGVPRRAGSKPPRETPDPERAAIRNKESTGTGEDARSLVAGEKRGSSHLAGAAQPPRGGRWSRRCRRRMSSPRDAGATRFLPPAPVKDEDETASRRCDSHVAIWQVSRDRFPFLLCYIN